LDAEPPDYCEIFSRKLFVRSSVTW